MDSSPAHISLLEKSQGFHEQVGNVVSKISDVSGAGYDKSKDLIGNLPTAEAIRNFLPDEKVLAALAIGGSFVEWAAKVDELYSKEPKKTGALEVLGNTTKNVSALALLVKVWPKLDQKMKECSCQKEH